MAARVACETEACGVPTAHSIPVHPHGLAVLIEIRPHPGLERVLLNFHEMLPRAWPIEFVHGWGNERAVLNSIALQPALSSGALRLRPLSSLAPPEVAKAACSALGFVGRARKHGLAPWNVRAWYNFLLESSIFWAAWDVPSLLLFEVDTALCPTPKRSLHHFTEFVMVGAPFGGSGCVDGTTGEAVDESNALCTGMNSGLALWSVPVMRRVVSSPRSPQGNSTAWPSNIMKIPIIDMWYARLLKLAVTNDPEAADYFGTADIRVPTQRVATLFSVSGAYAGNYTPIGVHSPTQAGVFTGWWAKRPQLWQELIRRCPAAAHTSFRWHPDPKSEGTRHCKA